MSDVKKPEKYLVIDLWESSSDDYRGDYIRVDDEESHQKAINEVAARGYRLVCVVDRYAYFERDEAQAGSAKAGGDR